MRFLFSAIVLCSMILLASFAVQAHDYKTGDLHIKHPRVVSPLPGAKVTAGYLEITNLGSEAERLLSVSADFAGKSEVHTMTMEDGIMKMRPLIDGIEIPAGETVVLKRGGLHLMFMKLQEEIDHGKLHPVTLTFEKAGKVEVELFVVDPSEIQEEAEEHDHSGHSG